MPRASWRGFLRLSLVSCPIYLSPATTRTKPIRLHQVWQPAPVDLDEDDLPDRGAGQQGSAPSVPRPLAEDGSPDGDQSPAATRITLRPHDPGTGEEIVDLEKFLIRSSTSLARTIVAFFPPPARFFLVIASPDARLPIDDGSCPRVEGPNQLSLHC